MRMLFQAAFLEGTDQDASPLGALALYEAFKELTPSGPVGDEILSRLAERLVEIDLLPEASAMLEDLLRYRVSGLARAEVGARLAEIQLLDHDPAGALLSLDDSAFKEVSPELAVRRRLLRAGAFTDLDHHADALDLLLEDPRPEAIALRAKVLGKMGDWAGAGEAHAELLPALPAKRGLSSKESDRIMRTAVAYILAGETAELAWLHRNYDHAMKATEHSEAFALLASGLDANGEEDVRQSLELSWGAQSFLDGSGG